MGQRIRTFGNRGEPHEDNRCLIYTEQFRRDIFEYHNLSPTEVEKVIIFSRVIGDKRIRVRISVTCKVCKRTDFEALKSQMQSSVTFYDEQEVKRINQTLRSR